ncbi:hypothetical protein [Azospirillum palustre]
MMSNRHKLTLERLVNDPDLRRQCIGESLQNVSKGKRVIMNNRGINSDDELEEWISHLARHSGSRKLGFD